MGPRDSAPGTRGIRGVAQQIDGFLTEQVQYLETVMDRCGEILDREQAIRESAARLEREQQQVQAESQRLEEDAERLAEAWLLVEAAHRRALEENGAPATPSAAVPSAESSSLPGDVRGAEQTDVDAEIWNSPVREVSERQFQQLRREIGKHKRKRR